MPTAMLIASCPTSTTNSATPAATKPWAKPGVAPRHPLPVFLRWLLAVLLVWAMAGVAAAATVSGTLTQNTRWTLDQSPYLVSADLTLDNNATLTVDAGVEVRFALGAALIVKQGALLANGTSSAQIRFTSNRDGVGQKGDWGPIRFLAGNTAGNSTLTQALVLYGKGLDIQGASPSLNNLNLYGNQGAAITLDVTASPTGRGLTASSNDVNAIVVKPGVLTGQVTWGLVGIPYLVEQGWVTVGQRSLALEPDGASINPGVTLLLRAYLAQPAPAGGLSLTVTSDNSAASTPATAMVAEGQTWVDIPVTGQSQGSAVITISQAQLGNASVRLTIASSKTLQVSPGQLTLATGASQSLAVRLAQPAPADGLTVKFTTSDPAIAMVTPTLAFSAGAQTGTVTVVGASEGNALLSASAQGYGTTTAGVTVASTALILPGSLTVAPGSSLTATLQLTTPAPAGGLNVRLTNPRSDLYSVPASVSVAAGATSASFVLQGLSAGSTLLTADASGYRTASAPVTVDTFTLNLDPTGDVSVPVNNTVNRNVVLSKAAPKGGMTVSLATANSALVDTMPSEVFVPGGSTQGLQPVGFRGLVQGDTSVSLSAPGLQSRAVPVKVTTPLTLVFEDNNYYFAGVQVATGYQSRSTTSVYLYSSASQATVAAETDVVVSLSCADATLCSVPASVVIPAGQARVSFPVSGLRPGTSTLQASAEGYSAAVEFPVLVSAPQLTLKDLDGARSTSGGRDQFSVSLGTGIADFHGPGFVVQDLISPAVVDLRITDASPPGVVTGFHDSATGGSPLSSLTFDSGNTTATAYVDTPTSAGSYTVTAAWSAGGATATSATQSVTTPSLTATATSGTATAVAGRATTAEVVTLNRPTANSSDSLTVTVACANAAICTTPATVTFGPWQYQVMIPVTGVATGTTTLSFAASGYSVPAPMAIQVVEPRVVFQMLDGGHVVGGDRDDFYVSLDIPGSSAWNITSAQDLAVQVSLTQQSPAGIVDAIYDWPTDGNVVATTSILIGEGDTYGHGLLWVGSPTAAGSYVVTVTIPGLGSWSSDPQIVATPSLGFQTPAPSGQPTRIPLGLTADISVGLDVGGKFFAPSADTLVTLACADASLCAVTSPVTLTGGEVWGTTVSVTGKAVGATTLKATSATAPSGPDLSVVVENPVLVFPPPYAVTTVNLGSSPVLYVALAVSDGNTNIHGGSATAVTLSSSDPSVLSGPSSLTILAGSSWSSGFTLSTHRAGQTTLTATAPGFTPATITITVQ